MKPYFDRDGVRLYHGDSVEALGRGALLEELEASRPVVVTDPVWPNGARAFPGLDAWALWGAVAPRLAAFSSRIVVVLGCDSDPRFLEAVPKSFPFVRVSTLRYPAPSYKGPLLIDRDIAYVFGEAFVNGDGEHRTLPGEGRGRQGLGKQKWARPGDSKPATPMRSLDRHPCPRNPDHMVWLVENFTRPSDLVLDPFSGSGTTLWACRELGRRAIGIEIDERWCAQTVDRLAQGVLFPAEASKPAESAEAPQ